MKDCIVVILSKVITFILLDESPVFFKDEVGNLFQGQFETDNNGFFDWLRSNDGNIIGVRWAAVDDDDFQIVAKSLKNRPNVDISEHGSLCIYFGSETSFDHAISCDQNFGENNFYVSDSGDFAMSFSTFGLEEGAIQKLNPS